MTDQLIFFIVKNKSSVPTRGARFLDIASFQITLVTSGEILFVLLMLCYLIAFDAEVRAAVLDHLFLVLPFASVNFLLEPADFTGAFTGRFGDEKASDIGATRALQLLEGF